VKGAEAALRTFGFKDAPMVHAVSLVPEQSFRELTGFLPEIESSVSYIVLSNDIIFESVREVQKLFGFKEKNVYVMSGDHWFYYSRPEHSNFIMREATRCGRTSAKIMTEMLAAPSMFQNTHEIIETNIYAFEDKSKRSSAKGRKTLKILLYKSPISDPIIKLLKNFEIRSGIKVEYELFAGYEEMYNVLFENEGGYYKSADICMIDIPWINQAAEEGKALSLTQHLTNIEECFLPDVWRDFLAKDGQAYAIPIAYGTQILMYRKDLFEDPLLNQAFYKLFGVPLDVPKTWNEYNAVARFFTREYNPKSPVLYGNCLLGDNPVGLVEEFLARQWAFRGRFTKDDRIVINSVQNIQAVRNLRESYRYSRQDILKYQNDEHVMELTSGNVAMINVFNLSINGIFDEQFDKVRDKLGYATLPGRKSVYGAWGLAVCTDSPKKKEAFEFLKWYTSEQIAVLTNILSGFIPQKTVYHSEQTKNIFPWNENVPAFMETACMREEIRTKNNKIINEFRINKIIGDALASCLYEGVDEHDALTTAKDRIEYLVAERTE
jgi:multiple sugar transport system substrate-binding protein